MSGSGTLPVSGSATGSATGSQWRLVLVELPLPVAVSVDAACFLPTECQKIVCETL